VRVIFKREEKDFLFRKYKEEGMNTWDASNKVNSVQKFLIDFASNLKNKYNKRIERLQKQLNNRKAKSFNIIKVKSQIELEMENQFTKKFEETLQTL